MKNVMKTLAVCLAASLVLVSCNKNKNGDYYDYMGIMTVTVDDNTFYFTDNSGETYFPGDVTRFKYSTVDGEGDSKDGRRVYVFFSFLSREAEGYDYNIALYGVDDILSKEVEVATTEEEVEAAGDDRIVITDALLGNEWLDIKYTIATSYGSTHKLTLLDNQTAEVPEDMPANYQYLELRQDADISGYEYDSGLVSYRLDGYSPAITGKEGFYVRIRDLEGSVKYVSIKYNAPTAE